MEQPGDQPGRLGMPTPDSFFQPGDQHALTLLIGFV
jgi:hypothetical protein